MKIYTVDPDPSYRVLVPENEFLAKDYWEFNCKPISPLLAPYELKAFFSKDQNKLPIPDIANIDAFTFAFNSRSVDLLSRVLLNSGELIPFIIERETWYLFNPLNSIDGIFDEERSTYEYSRFGRRLFPLKCHFRTEYLAEHELFKIPNDYYHWTYCVDRSSSKGSYGHTLFELVNSNKLTGLNFRKVFEE